MYQLLNLLTSNFTTAMFTQPPEAHTRRLTYG